MAKLNVKELIKQTAVVDAKSGSDTIRIWESYKEQANIWRALSLIQIPITLFALIVTLYFGSQRNITLNVPHKPLPGIYTAEELPQSEFIDVSVNFINLVSSYQPAIAKRQFLEARKLIIEPMLSKFDVDVLTTELKAVENTNRSQYFFADPTTMVAKRTGRDVTVVISGDRLKIVAGKEMPIIPTRYTVTLTTIPRTNLNPYGIVIKNARIENIETR